jgi:hypothetical protein
MSQQLALMERSEQPDSETLRAVADFARPTVGPPPGSRHARRDHKNYSHTAGNGKAPLQVILRWRLQLPLLGSNQDSPDPEPSGRGG